jgi:ElaB/YqjD/DUF883 family membrane-anchored ribosome-binding protein
MNTTNDIKDKAQQWQGDAENAAQDLRSKVQEKARDLQEAAQEWQRRAVESSRKAAKAADEYVHENPWPVIGSVALGFFALGFLLGRSRD